MIPVPLVVHTSGEEEKQASSVPPLTKLRREIGQTLYLTKPWLAHERGWSAVGLRLGSTGADATLGWSTLLEDKIRELETMLSTDLPPTKRAEYSSLLGWMQTEHSLVSLRGTERRDPVAFVDRVDRTLRAVVASDAMSEVDRAKEVSLILVDLPRYWQEARESLAAPAADWSLEAMGRAFELARWMQYDLELALDPSRLPPKAKKVFDQALAGAVESTQGFHGWLGTFGARSGELVRPLEEGTWARMVGSLTGTELGVDAVKALLLQSVAELEEGLVDPELAEGAPPKVDPAVMTGVVTAASRGAMRFAIDQGLVSMHVSTNTRLQARVLSGRTAPGPAVHLRFGKRGSNWIDLEPEGTTWSADVRSTRRRLFTDEGQRTIGIRYGFPGEMLLRFEANAGVDRDKALIVNRATLEGWGLYTLDWLPRVAQDAAVENPYARDKNLQAAFDYAFLLEAARMLACLELHHERLEEQVVIDNFARRARFDPTSATEEIRRALHDPLLGVGFLGYLEMKANERQLTKTMPEPFALMNNVHAILRNPHLRAVDMRNNLFPYVVAGASEDEGTKASAKKPKVEGSRGPDGNR